MAARSHLRTRVGIFLLATAVAAAQSPQPPIQGQDTQADAAHAGAGTRTIRGKLPSSGDRRRAVQLFLSGSKLYANQQFEKAVADYAEAAQLDPGNKNYALALEVARSHAVTALIQVAAKDRLLGNIAGARDALTHAQQIDPANLDVAEHLRQLNGDSDETGSAIPGVTRGPALGGFEHLEPAAGTHSFHLRNGQRQIIQQVFRAWGIDATLDDSIRGPMTRLDLEDADFEEATRILSMLTESFFVPIDAHRVLVAHDTRSMRQQYERNGVETVSLAGLTTNEMTDMGNLAKTVFQAPQTAVDPSAGTLTLRAPESTLDAFNSTYRDLMEGRGQVMIDVRLIQVAHTSQASTGVQPPQTITAFNVYTEEQSILNANQSLVQQIISSGLAAPGDTLAILGILLASGQVSSSLFSNGVLLFGGGISLSGISPAPLKVNLNLNSSESRELDDYRLQLQDGEEGTLKSGTRYPIMTASFSSLGTNSLNIPGLNGAGTSSSLSSLLSSLQGASTNIPQVQYQDLGLTMKATPRIQRSGDVALTIDLQISALAGSAINGVPILANRSYQGVVTLRANQGVVIASEMDESETRAISGIPGLSEIPGFNNITDKEMQKNTATLVIILTPHLVRNPHGLGHSPMLRVDRGNQTP